jgi:Na+/proline symporter
MVSQEAALLSIAVALAFFAWVGFRVRQSGASLEEYLVARNSQGAWALGLSFLASGMGAWILFAPPEVGALVGLVAVAGYAVGAASPIAFFYFLGLRMREVAPEGLTLTELVLRRFGRPFQAYVIGISITYMFIFITAELTAIGGVTAILSGGSARAAIVAVAAVTLAYTAYGGLRASLQTDRWQAFLVVALLAIGAVAAITALSDPGSAIADSGLLGFSVDRLEVAATLVIAVTAANLFHAGYWQRVWAARDGRALGRGAAIGIVATVPIVFVVGLLGVMAAGAGLELGAPPVPFFAHVSSRPDWVLVAVLLLGVALVCSSVDTLINGLTALVAAERRGMSLGVARAVTVGLMVPAVVIAWQGYSVLRLFLIADLLCAATVVPALLSLWPRATSRAVLFGAVCGLLGAVVPNAIDQRSLAEAVRLATFPGAIATLTPFAGAIVASSAAAVGASLLEGRRPLAAGSAAGGAA